MLRPVKLTAAAALLALGGCATLPNGPSVMAMPGTGKSFEQFRADDAVCRQFALEQIGGTTPNEASTSSGVKSAAVGAAVGAAAGALAGGHRSAGEGAAAGLVVGAVAGSAAGQSSGYSAQRRYDDAYLQCMYAKGNAVPVSGRLVGGQRPAQPVMPPPPPPGAVPPPPPYYAPPPPPR